ncbi:MAG: hypothetical protein ABI591_04920 [Kofleriaceae bacterium]
MAEPRAHPLFEQTRRALEGLRDVPTAHDLALRLELAWSREPLGVGLGGDDLGARTELINALCGTTLLARRATGCAPIRLRRGTTARVRARRDDGSHEHHVLAERGDDDATAERAAVHRRVVARAELADREVALERIDATLPRLVRARPTGWRLVLWPIWWVMSWLRRRDLVERTEASDALEVSRLAAAAVDKDVATLAMRGERDAAAYVQTVRALASARDVVELELEVASGLLASGVEVCELGGMSTSLDVVLIVEDGTLLAPGGSSVGTFDNAIAKLAAFSSAARAMRLARRARESIALTVAALDDQLSRAEDNFRHRLAKLEIKRIRDRPTFIAAQLERIRPQIVTSVNAVIEHASVHLGAELAAVGEAWIVGIANSDSSDALKETITRIETTATASMQRIAEETRTLVIGGGGGSAHDLYPELVAALIPLGLPDDVLGRRSAPALPPVEVLPSLATTSIAKLSGQWLGRVFRSLDSRRTEVREKTHAQIEQLRELATDELLDVEPQLHAAIEQVLAPQLGAACERQSAAVEAALTAEHAAIAAERSRLAPAVEQRDRARSILLELRGEIAALETELPECAAASEAVGD